MINNENDRKCYHSTGDVPFTSKCDSSSSGTFVSELFYHWKCAIIDSLCYFLVMPAVVIRQRKPYRRKNGVFIYFEGIILYTLQSSQTALIGSANHFAGNLARD